MTYVEINGAAPEVEALHRAATMILGHFTTMQVRGGAVAGLDLHLERLRQGSAELFPGTDPAADDTIRALIVHALRGEPDATVRVTMLSAADAMVSVLEPGADTPPPAIRARTIVYERELPHLKHRATLGLFHHAAEARRAGFDDVVFTGRDGLLREGSVWNLVLWDGARVVWPEAPMLAGVTMRLLRRELDAAGVAQTSRALTAADLPEMTGAAAVNSRFPAQPIAAVDDVVFPDTAALAEVLGDAWRRVAWQGV
ncbi:aminotransferase class IV [Actinoplanes flavus]|uniref:Aminotransferase class IV n=1 Tax=Actinoplanes flavus TaxID=2820290 RepID=A0ABS3UL37_9ACTN|nr:aminotransferase class IV [Actinoplanes flavus]MBO3739151.1 aminotransferase class IV [Actinoplanes flavus]